MEGEKKKKSHLLVPCSRNGTKSNPILNYLLTAAMNVNFRRTNTWMQEGEGNITVCFSIKLTNIDLTYTDMERPTKDASWDTCDYACSTLYCKGKGDDWARSEVEGNVQVMGKVKFRGNQDREGKSLPLVQWTIHQT